MNSINKIATNITEKKANEWSMEYSKKKLYSTQSDYTREDGTVLQQLKKAAQYTI